MGMPRAVRVRLAASNESLAKSPCRWYCYNAYGKGLVMIIPIIILAIEDDGDREFMITVYTELRPLMKSTAKAIVKSDDVAEDMVHDTVVELIKDLGLIRGYERKRLVSYIKRAVTNNALDHLRKRETADKHTLQDFHDDSAVDIPDDSFSTVERLEMAEEYEQLGRAVERLSERERELLHLKYGLRYSDEAIGDHLGISKDSVRQYLTRARRMAKEQFLKGWEQ